VFGRTDGGWTSEIPPLAWFLCKRHSRVLMLEFLAHLESCLHLNFVNMAMVCVAIL
jgi:hypothetical protein